jgi:Ion transport protein
MAKRNKPKPLDRRQSFAKRISPCWIPPYYECYIPKTGKKVNIAPKDVPERSSDPRVPRRVNASWRRRIFLTLTEAETSRCSALMFGLLVIAITVMCSVMIMQTMPRFQYTPTDCVTCGGETSYLFEDDMLIIGGLSENTETEESDRDFDNANCECPPTPAAWTVRAMDWVIAFLSIEWVVRMLMFTPPAWEHASSMMGRLWQSLRYIFSLRCIMDALAIFPYYVETTLEADTLMPLRLLRLFQLFQLIRLGQYSSTFRSLTSVLGQSSAYVNLLLAVLLFGAALFGSMMFWFERGSWLYDADSGSYQYMRTDLQGNKGITPFQSIPATFWWFIVTATTVGYGDTFPVTAGGKAVATLTMLMGLFVVTFPVSVFSDLWSKELKRLGAINDLKAALDSDDEDSDDEDLDVKTPSANKIENSTKTAMTASTSTSLSTQGNGTNHPDTSETAGLPRFGQGFVDPQNKDDMYHYQANRMSSMDRYSRELSIYNDDTVTMEREDWEELVVLVQGVHESQQQIRSILRKYRPQYD